MPLYEYECKACGNRFENIQKFSDPLVTLCPKCGKESVEQMISAPAFQFKGSGWYVNDYATKKSGNSAGGGDGAESKSGSDSSAKSGGEGSDAKSETKSEGKSESKNSSSESRASSESNKSSASESRTSESSFAHSTSSEKK